jgi:hypothetical protein
MKKWAFTLLILAGMTCLDASASGQEPGWSGRVIAFGEQRARIESTPIIYRSYRPLHFYGNTVRRRYYHGTALPLPTEVVRASTGIASVQ